jgi:citrate lyase beta subunit
MEKSSLIRADALIFDLEDAVLKSDTTQALKALVELLQSAPLATRKILVRINIDYIGQISDSLTVFVRNGHIQGLVIPKVNQVEDVAVIHALAPDAPLWVMVETAKSLVNLKEICVLSTHMPLKGLILGPNDLRADLRLRPQAQRAELSYAMSHMITHARAYGLLALDGVYNHYTDEAGFAADATIGRRFGFDGKTLIHPSQIEGAKTIFAPAADEILWAKRVVEAFAMAPEAAVLSLKGEMIERLHLAQAKDILAAQRDT